MTKRYLYGAALICLLGAGVCLMRWSSLPKTVGSVIVDVENEDPDAKEEVADLANGDPVGDDWLRGAEAFVLGVAVFSFLGKRAR